MKICTCNNCGGIYEDVNPSDESIDYPAEMLIDGKLEWFFVEFNKPEEYPGCPKCCTDSYLVDNIPEWKMKELYGLNDTL